jgi:hypothetical protein
MRTEPKTIATWAIRGLGGAANIAAMLHEDGCTFDETVLNELGDLIARLATLHSSAVGRSVAAGYAPQSTARHLALAVIDDGGPQQIRAAVDQANETPPASPAD